MSIVNIFAGQRGVAGKDGQDAVGVGDISIPLPIAEILSPNNLGFNGVFKRDEEATILNRYGFVDYSPPSVTTQSIYVTNDISNATFWSDPGSTWELNNQTAIDPNGSPTANNVTVTSQSETLGFATAINTVGGGIYRVSFYIEVLSGVVAGVSVGFSGSDPIPMSFDPAVNGWQRVTATISALSTNAFNNIYFVLDTNSAEVNLWQFNGTEGGKLYDVIPANGTIQTVENEGFRIRQNSKGSLIEGDTANLATYSESVDRWTGLGVVTVSPYDQPDIFGETGKLIQINAESATQFAIVNALDVSAVSPSEGDDIYVSFYAGITAGQVGSVIVACDGSDDGAPIELEGSKLTRYFAVVPYGTDPNVSISFAGATGAVVVIEGLQVELDGFSSYVPSGAVYGSRGSEVVSVPYNLIAPNIPEPWSMLFYLADIQTTARKKSVISGTLGLFEVYLSGSDLIVKAGQEIVFSDALGVGVYSGEIALTYSGTELSLYNDGQLYQVVSADLSVTLEQDLYLGSNNGEHSIDAFLSEVRAFDVELSTDQLTYYSNRTPTL